MRCNLQRLPHRKMLSGQASFWTETRFILNAHREYKNKYCWLHTEKAILKAILNSLWRAFYNGSNTRNTRKRFPPEKWKKVVQNPTSVLLDVTAQNMDKFHSALEMYIKLWWRLIKSPKHFCWMYFSLVQHLDR